MYVWLYVCMYACMHVCMYVCVSMYIQPFVCCLTIPYPYYVHSDFMGLKSIGQRSISPLLWAIDSGTWAAAESMIEDLLTLGTWGWLNIIVAYSGYGSNILYLLRWFLMMELSYLSLCRAWRSLAGSNMITAFPHVKYIPVLGPQNESREYWTSLTRGYTFNIRGIGMGCLFFLLYPTQGDDPGNPITYYQWLSI